jgi:anti-sigma28 factor (negative regulator of flagellin synthesis)
MSRTFYSRYVKGDNIIIEISSSDNKYVESLKNFIDSYDTGNIESSIINEGRIKTIKIIISGESSIDSEYLIEKIMEYPS